MQLALEIFCLPCFHFLPVDESIDIVCPKGAKADNHGNVPALMDACQYPHNDQYQVIGGICQGKIRTSPEGQIHRQEAGGYRQRARDDVGRMKIL